FFFQAEDGIRDFHVTGVQTCALPIYYPLYSVALAEWRGFVFVNLDEKPKDTVADTFDEASVSLANWPLEELVSGHVFTKVMDCKIGRASCRERGEMKGAGG